MLNLTTPKLHELAPFYALGDISKEFKVDFTLYGGAASRVAMFLTYRSGYDFDLFDLTPFTSDIDLQHSGSKEQNLEIKLAISERVPFSCWCRWSLLDRESGAKAAENRALSTRVPLRSISYSTTARPSLAADTAEDLKNRRVSFVRCSQYGSSVLAKEGRDLEIFGLLMSMNVVTDLQEISGEKSVDYDLTGALEWLRYPETQEQFSRASDVAGLTARLWHLLAPQLARVDSNSVMAQEVMRLISRLDVMQRFDIDLDAISEEHSPLTVSKITGDGKFRVPELSPEIVVGREAMDAVESVFKELDLGGQASPMIDPALELVAVVPKLTVTAGTSDTSAFDDAYFSGPLEDFLHVAWKHDVNAPRVRSEGLTASIIPWTHSLSALAPNPVAVGGIFQSGRSWVRIDLSETTEQGSTAKELTSSLLILQARHD
jgi:hypothetical protein